MTTLAAALLALNLNTEKPNFEVIKDTPEITRVYMFKNSRIKKALSFKTKNDRPKLA